LPGADTINFAAGVAGQTIAAIANDTTNPFAFGPTAFVITSDITIAADPSAAGITISGNNSHRIFGVLPGGSLTLQFLTLTNGRAQGGTGGTGTTTNAISGGGGGAGLGGAAFIAQGGTLNLIQSTMTGNQALGGAGGAAVNIGAGTFAGGGGASAAFNGGNVAVYDNIGAGGAAWQVRVAMLPQSTRLVSAARTKRVPRRP